jgi:hypothetical protein
VWYLSLLCFAIDQQIGTIALERSLTAREERVMDPKRGAEISEKK